MARWTRAVATLESTPPLTADSTGASANLLADARDAVGDDRIRASNPGAAPQISDDEAAQDFFPAGGVVHLGVELHAKAAPLPRRPWRRRGCCALVARRVEAGRQRFDAVAVRHPHRLAAVGEERVGARPFR